MHSSSVVAAAHIEEDFATLRARSEPLRGRLACVVAGIRKPAHRDRSWPLGVRLHPKPDC